MADKKKNRGNFDGNEKPTKEEKAVAKFLRFNVPSKKAKLHSMEVHCFFASAAVDALLESKWSASKNAKEPLFFKRSSCVSYCHRLLEKGLFHRAERVRGKKDKGDRGKKSKAKDSADKDSLGTGDKLRERKSKKDKKEKKEEADLARTTAYEGEEVQEEKKAEDIKEEKKDDKKKKEKPVKLVMTDDQRFLDGEENIYVWIYDPVSAKTLFIGSLIVFGCVALCLFPLWPDWVRVGVHYVSLAGVVFVGFILSLTVLRLILFCAIWVLSLGRHHLWMLPNLTEDVGFFESFKPLYTYEKVLRHAPSASKKKKGSPSKSPSKASKKAKTEVKEEEEEGSGSEHEFEMIDRSDIEEEGEERAEGEEEEEEEGQYGAEEDEDFEEEEEENGAHDDLEEEYDEEEDEEEFSEPKKDK